MWRRDPIGFVLKETIGGPAAGPTGSVNYKTIPETGTPVYSGYDPVGNRRSRQVTSTDTLANRISDYTGHTFDERDRVSPNPNNSFTYDANGNTTSYGTSPQAGYFYDAENRLIKQSLNGTDVTFVYDADGNRVAKTVGTSRTVYLVEDRNPTGYAQVMEELNFTEPDGTGLAACWPLDDGAGSAARDASGGGHPGTLVNGPVWAGGGLQFDGQNDRVDLAGTASSLAFIENTLRFTIAGWIRLDGDRSTRQQIIASTASSGDKGFWFHWENYGSGYGYQSLRFVAAKGTSGSLAVDCHSPDGATINDNNWHHIAVVGDGSHIFFYVDGQSRPVSYMTEAQGYGTGDATRDANLGALSVYSVPFKGALCEMRVYNRPLSVNEIAALAGARVKYTYGLDLVSQTRPVPATTELSHNAPSTSGLVGHWSFNEASGSAADSSGNGYTGTLQSGASFGAGALGAGVLLSGTGAYVQVGDQPNLRVSSKLTISAWIYPTPSSGYRTIVNKEGEYEIALVNGVLQWAIANSKPGWNWVSTSYSPPINQWTHIALAYDGEHAATYINGVQVHGIVAYGTIGDFVPSQNDFRIGARQGFGDYFAGRIDEVRIYNRDLSGDEIVELSGSGATTVADVVLINQTRYFGYDGQGSARYLTDTHGSITDIYTYDAFGILIDRQARRTSDATLQPFTDPSSDVAPAGTDPTLNHYRYAGEQWDEHLAMYYLRARYYRPELGRFSAMDTFQGDPENPSSSHKYLYCQSDPANRWDPTGHESLISLSIGSTLSTSLESIYNGVVAGAGNAMQATLLGVQVGQSAPDILTAYIFDETGVQGVIDGFQALKSLFRRLGGSPEEVYSLDFYPDYDAFVLPILIGQESELEQFNATYTPQCLVGGTFVETSNGLKSIERIQRGELVWAWNERTDRRELRRVLDTFRRQRNELVTIALEDGTAIIATPDHPFYMANKVWKPAGELKTGDVLFDQNSSGPFIVRSAIKRHEVCIVYNMEVEDLHSYFVTCDGILTHNLGAGYNHYFMPAP